MHSLTAQPQVETIVWLNSTHESEIIHFDYDGLCSEIGVTVTPPGMNFENGTASAYTFYTNVYIDAGTIYDTYTLTLSPRQDHRIYNTTSHTIFYGNAISGFQVVKLHIHFLHLLTFVLNYEIYVYIGLVVGLGYWRRYNS